MLESIELINPDTDIKIFIDDNQCQDPFYIERDMKKYDNKRSPNQKISLQSLHQKDNPISPHHKMISKTVIDIEGLIYKSLHSETENLSEEDIFSVFEAMSVAGSTD